MEHILNAIEPSYVTISGVTVPLLFTMRAAAEMERELDMPYVSIISELLAVGEDGKDLPPMRWDRQAAVIACMIRAGGKQVTASDLMDAVHMNDAQELANAAIAEIMRKQPKGKAGSEKNG